MPTTRRVYVKSDDTGLPQGATRYVSLASAITGEKTLYPNLVTADVALEIECYAILDTTCVAVDGFTTDATRNIRIFSHDNHGGVWTTGAYRLQVADNYQAAIKVLNTSYVTLEGLQLAQTGAYATIALGSSAETEMVASRCIIKVSSAANRLYSAWHQTNNITRWRNCLFLGQNAGVSYNATSAYAALLYANYGTCYVENCTALGNANSAGFQHGISGLPYGSMTLRNCYAGGNAFGDYAMFGVTTVDHCASSDASGSAGLQSIAVALAGFVSTTAGSENLHLTAGSPLVGRGLDLSSRFTDDIDGELRATPWDIGADQHVAAGGTTWQIAGAAAGVGSDRGTLAVRRALAASVSCVASESGRATVRRSLAGAVSGAAGGSGRTNVMRGVGGSAFGVATNRGAVSAIRGLVGLSPCSAHGVGAVAALRALTGVASGVGSAWASLGARLWDLAGATAGAATSVARLFVRGALSGAGRGAAGGFGTLTAQRGLKGAIASTASMRGAMIVCRALIGLSRGVTAMAGLLALSSHRAVPAERTLRVGAECRTLWIASEDRRFRV